MTELQSVTWDVRLDGRAWSGDEVQARLEVLPWKREVIEGQLYWSDEDRLTMLAALLENVGARAAVRIGRPEVWLRAIAELGGSTGVR